MEFSPRQTSDEKCFCGRADDSSRYHQLNCSLWADQSWAQEHNLIVNALGFENRRLVLSVFDIDAAMLLQCAYHYPQALGDILVCTPGLEITDQVLEHCCSRKQFVIDGKTVPMELWNANINQHDNPRLVIAEQTKHQKHEIACAHTGYRYVAFEPWDLLLCAILLC
jgi:hypothetical protein